MICDCTVFESTAYLSLYGLMSAVYAIFDRHEFFHMPESWYCLWNFKIGQAIHLWWEYYFQDNCINRGPTFCWKVCVVCGTGNCVVVTSLCKVLLCPLISFGRANDSWVTELPLVTKLFCLRWDRRTFVILQSTRAIKQAAWKSWAGVHKLQSSQYDSGNKDWLFKEGQTLPLGLTGALRGCATGFLGHAWSNKLLQYWHWMQKNFQALQQFSSAPGLDLLLTILNMNSANVTMQPHQQETVTSMFVLLLVFEKCLIDPTTLLNAEQFPSPRITFCFHLHKRWKEWWCWCWWKKEFMDLPIDQSESAPSGAPSTGCL